MQSRLIGDSLKNKIKSLATVNKKDKLQENSTKKAVEPTDEYSLDSKGYPISLENFRLNDFFNEI